MDMEKADELLAKEEYDELLQLAEQEIAANPNNSEGYHYKVYCIENEDEQMACCDKILELKPDDFEIHELKARVLYGKDKKNVKKIIEYCDDVIANYSYTAAAYLMKARVLRFIDIFSLKNYEKMIIETCNKIIELEPDNIDANNILGDIYMERYEYEKAGDCYQKVLVQDENDYTANRGMVDKISNTEGVRKALEYCDSLIGKNPETYLGYDIKFSFLEDTAKTIIANGTDFEGGTESLKEEVQKLFNKLISLEGTNKWSLYDSLGLFYEEDIQDNDAAISVYKEAIDKMENKDDKEWFEDKIKMLQESNAGPFPRNDKGALPLKMYQNENRISNSNGLLIIIIFVIIVFAVYFYYSGANFYW